MASKKETLDSETQDIKEVTTLFIGTLLALQTGAIVITTRLNGKESLEIGVQSNLGGQALTLKLLKECVSKLEEDLSSPSQ